MKMKFVVNGVEKEIEILYGARAILTYDGIVDHAGEDPIGGYTVTYRCGDRSGVLSRNQAVVFSVNTIPVFNVAHASNA